MRVSPPLAIVAVALVTAYLPLPGAAANGELGLLRYAAAIGPADARRPVVTGVPIYPEKARDERRTGEVVVCFRIRDDGIVARPTIKRSTDRIFNRAARRAARETRFAPALPGATNGVDHQCMTFRFELESLAHDVRLPEPGAG